MSKTLFFSVALALRAQSKVAHSVIFLNIKDMNSKEFKAFFVYYATVYEMVVKLDYFTSAIEVNSKEAPFDSKEAVHVFTQFFAVASRVLIRSRSTRGFAQTSVWVNACILPMTITAIDEHVYLY